MSLNDQYKDQVIDAQKLLIEKMESYIEDLNKIISLQDEIIENYDEVVNVNPERKEKINHLKLVINNAKMLS